MQSAEWKVQSGDSEQSIESKEIFLGNSPAGVPEPHLLMRHQHTLIMGCIGDDGDDDDDFGHEQDHGDKDNICWWSCWSRPTYMYIDNIPWPFSFAMKKK